jgi:putative transposase
MRYRRSRAPGGTYFFTIVTQGRKKILCVGDNPRLLKNGIDCVQARRPFTIDAIVLLLDHLHCIWTLPENDADFSTRWMLIKSAFTRQLRAAAGQQMISGQSAWQNRFCKHQIRDDADFARHVEYIHYNPVKHGFAAAPSEWKYSSFRRY